jgi:hypothetical protein
MSDPPYGSNSKSHVPSIVTWTERIGTWWPADHTISGSPVAVVLEGKVGGRIYERAKHGEEHDWGW